MKGNEMARSKVLLAGETWVTPATHIKGFDQFWTVTFHRGAEIVRNGLIGKVKEVEVGLPQGRLGHKPGSDKVEEPPAGVDYDFWCGPSKKLPFMAARFHFNWRWNLAFGGGQLLDWICHHNDIAHWGLDEDLGGPLEVEAVDFKYPANTAVYDALVRTAGVPSNQLFVVGHGSNHPVVSNATPAGQARNRRVELVIYPETVTR